MPRLRSAKSMRVVSDRCMASIAAQIHGRVRRMMASGANASSRPSPPQVARCRAVPGRPRSISRSQPGRASGFTSTRSTAVPSTQEGLTSFVYPLYE